MNSFAKSVYIDDSGSGGDMPETKYLSSLTNDNNRFKHTSDIHISVCSDTFTFIQQLSIIPGQIV